MDYKYHFKVILVGNAGVGKTAMVRRFTKGFFPFQEAPTIGVDMAVKTVKVNGEKVKFKIWDSAGQERFKSLTSSYFRNADAAILVYGIDNEESFNGLQQWAKQLEKCGKTNTVKIIVGNKSDLNESRVVSIQSAVTFAMTQNASAAMECSAKENDNIELLFEELARELISMSGDTTGYQEGNRWGCRDNNVCKERLLDPMNQNQNNNGSPEKKLSLFSFPELSLTCFRKICGLC